MTTDRFFKIEYAALPSQLFGITNTVQQNHAKGTRTVAWQLNSHPLTAVFASLCAQTAKDISYNFYSARTSRNILAAKSKLNLVIDEIQLLMPGLIDSSLKVNDTDYVDVEHSKLNELHFIFEKYVIIQETPDRVKSLLEDINSLVHYIEQGVDSLPSMLMVYRLELSKDKWVKLGPRDYSNFKLSYPGQLMLDFNTVGKDLYHAWSTNDCELVQRGEVKQQEYCAPTVNVLIEDPTSDRFRSAVKSGVPADLVRWLDRNNLRRLLDVNDPKYRIGRHVLGEPVDEQMRTFEFWEELAATTPCVTRAYVE